jgi:hypothetical protein
MQSTLKRESKVPEIVVGEAFGGVIIPTFFHWVGMCAIGARGAYGYPSFSGTHVPI